MSTEPFDITEVKLTRLLRELTRAVDERSGACFTDEDMVDYVGEVVSPDSLRELDAHLATCPRCCEHVHNLSEAAGAWIGAGGDDRLGQLRGTLQQTWVEIARQELVAPSRRVPPIDARPRTLTSAGSAQADRSRVLKRATVVRVFAAAAVIVAALTSLILYQNRRLGADLARLRIEETDTQRREQDLRQQLARLQAGAAAEPTRRGSTDAAAAGRPASPVIAMTLAPGTLRSADSTGTTAVVVPRTTAWLELTLLLKRDDYPSGYMATVETVDGARVGRVSALKSSPGKGDQRSVTFRLPAQSFMGGDYLIRLDGLSEGGTVEVADNYTFRLERQPQ